LGHSLGDFSLGLIGTVALVLWRGSTSMARARGGAKRERKELGPNDPFKDMTSITSLPSTRPLLLKALQLSNCTHLTTKTLAFEPSGEISDQT
jgi:hypothetical protein